MPDWIELLLFVLIPAACAAGAHAAIRRIVPATRLIPHHDVAGFLVAIVGVLYAVVLGFLVVTVWTSFEGVQNTADLEAGYIGDAYGFASLLPAHERGRIQKSLAAYAIEVRDVEWKTLEQGKADPKARALLLEVVQQLSRTDVPSSGEIGPALKEEARRDRIFEAIRNVADNRRLRIIQAGSHLHRVMYLALLLGALMVLGFVFLFGVENVALQLTMTALVAGCMGLLFGVIVEFSSPYSGALRVTPAAWDYVIDTNGFRHLVTPSR